MYIGTDSELGIGRTALWEQALEWTENQKEGNRTLMNNGMNLFGLDGKYVEVSYELNQNGIVGYNMYNNPLTGEIGIRLRPGGDETDNYTTDITTNLGNTINATVAAEVTISGGANEFYKENFGRALFISEVTSRGSYMNPVPEAPNNLDRGIVSLIIDHSINLYENEKAYFDLNNISDTLPTK